MRKTVVILGSLALVTFGYLLGQTNALSPAALFAQDNKQGEAPPGPLAELSEETQAKIKAAANALTAAVEALKQEGVYESATVGINTFGILSGQFNSLRDLQSIQQVDPETFAALYAGLATPEVAVKLSRDPENRLTYDGRVIRIYPVSRLKFMYSVRAAITGEELPLEQSGGVQVKKKAEESEE